MKDQMLEAQRNMMAEMAQLLKGATDKGKAPMTITEEDNKDHPPGDNLTNPVIPDLNVAEKEDMRLELSRQLEERCRWLDEKFKALENADNRQGIDAKDLILVPDLVLPHKFKMPEFEKYNGTTCPEAHITIFCRRVTGYNIEKKPNESFRQYTQRWREVAMQVQPPLLEKETTMLFINTLKAPFITHMIESTTKSFVDIVMAGEMIENAIKGGKIEGETAKRSATRRKDNEVNNTNSYNSKTITVSQPRETTVGQQDSHKQGSGLRQNSEKVSFTPIPVTYRDLYQSLFNAHAIAPFHLKPLQPPYPKWYDAKAKCEYHAGISKHLIENCTGFKKAVERLIKMGVVKFDDTPSDENPLPNHGDQGVNAIGDTGMRRIKEDVAEREINYCEFNAEKGHEIQECEEFKALIQSLMDNKELEFYEAGSDEGHICTLEGGPKNQRVNQPRIIISLPRNNEVETQTKEDIASASKEVQDEGSYTRSGKRYDVEGVRVEPAKAKAFNKGKGTETPVNEPVKEEEAKEFLKFLKHSEYSMVEQLRKQPACISVLALVLSSELDRLVSNISADNFIYFNDDEIPPGGMGSTKALHITTRCKGYTLPSVLIDNGSALNVLPLSTLNRLPIDNSHMKTCHNVVRAFVGTERKVMGRIDIPLMIGPNSYKVDFLVIDIKPSYNCLLGRPWIHSARAVPSSLHQKLKLVVDGRLVTINAEEDIISTVTNDVPYVESNKEALECSFRSLEFVNATFISEGNEVPVPRISRTTRMGL
ncbi:uncharacterized protein LOC108472802 [Gossypium arboreum]|uniref:uncharacterized protein LOC108472802 n=1 Tax=Gossypium arboreum TaxID=29729 RepID=UPI0022F16523|nr:uncharacterized protein LOC108472802 [Gossypium arboreum]